VTRTFCVLTLGLLMTGRAPVARAQDTLRMTELQEMALRTDPRTAQFALRRRASDLRGAAIGSERLPQLTLNGWASHQSDLTQPGRYAPSAGFPNLPLDRWQSTVDVDQLLYDGGTISRRRELERARYAEEAAEVNVALYGLRSEVNSAFFSAFLLQQRSAEYDALITDLDARLAAVRARVEAGTALRREAAELEAERVRATLQRDEAQAARRASLAVLADFVGMPIDTAAVLVLPTDEPEKTQQLTPAALAMLRSRPEFERLKQSRQRLGQEAALASSENAPRVSAFAQGGVGLPGLDQFRTSSDAFWQAGVRVQWRPWTWRSAGREVQALEQEQRVLDTEEDALARSLSRTVISYLEDIKRLSAALAEDQRVVNLRAEVERQARLQHDEGAITTADYVETRTNVLEARLILQRHRVELAQARAAYLTTLGLTPR
jgi:outer membrane protein TolC